MKLPKNEKVYLALMDVKEAYVVTANPKNREVYFLYKKVREDDYERISSSSNPLKLEEKVFRM